MVYIPNEIRRASVSFLQQISDEWELQPTTKYCALMFYNDRFLWQLESFNEDRGAEALRTSCLNLYPLSVPNLMLLSIVSLWISIKVHESEYPKIRQLRRTANAYSIERQFTGDDLIEAEIIFLQVIDFDIRTRPCPYFELERLHAKLRVLRVAEGMDELVTLRVCEDILDLVYEWRWDRIELASASNQLVAAAVLAAGSYVCSAEHFRPPSAFQLLTWLSVIITVPEAEIFIVCNQILSLAAKCSVLVVENSGFRLRRRFSP